MHPRKLTKNPASTSGTSRPRKRSSTSTSIIVPTSKSPPTTTATTSNSSFQQNEPISPLSSYPEMTLGSSAAFGVPAQSTRSSSGSFGFSSSTQPTSISLNSDSSQHLPTLPDRRPRSQSIPIAFLINAVPQSPRPFTFSSPTPSSPSPPPVELSSVFEARQVDLLSAPAHRDNPHCRSASPTRPLAPFPLHHDFSSATSRSFSERRSYSTSSFSILHTQSESLSLSTSTAEQAIRSVQGVGDYSAGFSSSSPSTPTSERVSVGGSGSHSKVSRIDTSSSASTDPLRPESTINNTSNSGRGGSGRDGSTGRSRSRSKAIKYEQQHQQQFVATEELIPSRPPRQLSLRRTTNPDLKTTKTGKILHKTKKAGVNKKSTAYNRFLQQQSKHFAKHHPHLTPQQRMKLIAKEWAVSEKNAHTTRRRSRFSTEESGQQQISSDRHLPSSSSLSPLSPPAAFSSSLWPTSHTITGSSSSSNITTVANASLSSSSSSSAITSSSSSTSRSSRSRSRTTIATSHDQPFFSATNSREAGPLRAHNPALLSTTTTTITNTPRPAVAAVSQPNTRSLDCIPSPVRIEQEGAMEEEYEE